MVYEATVPVHRRLLWSAVTDPERLFGAVPNLTVETCTGQSVAARLRLRAGDRSITFRGIARLVEIVPERSAAVLEIEAVHGRSNGALGGRLEMRLLTEGSGTRILIEPRFAFSGDAPAIAAPRLAEAAGRLIPRWFHRLVEVVAESEPEAESESESEAKPETGPRNPPVTLSVVRNPALTLITGDAEDASPSPKAPLRLVQDAERDEAEAPVEADLWSRGTAQWPGPVWIMTAAGLTSLGFALFVLRRMLRRG